MSLGSMQLPIHLHHSQVVSPAFIVADVFWLIGGSHGLAAWVLAIIQLTVKAASLVNAFQWLQATSGEMQQKGQSRVLQGCTSQQRRRPHGGHAMPLLWPSLEHHSSFLHPLTLQAPLRARQSTSHLASAGLGGETPSTPPPRLPPRP